MKIKWQVELVPWSAHSPMAVIVIKGNCDDGRLVERIVQCSGPSAEGEMVQFEAKFVEHHVGEQKSSPLPTP